MTKNRKILYIVLSVAGFEDELGRLASTMSLNCAFPIFLANCKTNEISVNSEANRTYVSMKHVLGGC